MNKGVEAERNGQIQKQALGSCRDSNHGQKSLWSQSDATAVAEHTQTLGHHCGVPGSLRKSETQSNMICTRSGKGLSGNTIHSVNQCLFQSKLHF